MTIFFSQYRIGNTRVNQGFITEPQASLYHLTGMNTVFSNFF
ncbi:Uncharacterised protein [Klebsiella pneumoniae]|nr:Uncharacterised protein [Klebsiella pneumoniae]